MGIKPLKNFSEQDVINAVNKIFGSHNKYKMYIEFSNHTETDALNSENDVFNLGTEVFEIPVLPEKLKINNDADNETTKILGLGEVNLLKGRHLKTISFESFFPSTYQTLTLSNNLTKIKNIFSYVPNNYDTSNINGTLNAASAYSHYADLLEGLYRFANGEVPPYVNSGYIAMTHHEFKDKFVKALEENTVIRFIMSGMNINMLMTIEKFDWDIRYGCDDIYFSVDLKEYKPFKYNKVCTKETDYSVGDTVKYKKNKWSDFSEGEIIKTDIVDGTKKYNVREKTQKTALKALNDYVEDFWNTINMDKKINKDGIIGKQQ